MVTVILNTYNEKPEILKRAVESYLNQTYKGGIQIIISTVEGDTSTIFPLSNPEIEFSVLPIKDHPGKSPSGAYAQINHALKLISQHSQWLCYASGNDTAKPNKIVSEIATCLTHQKEVCYSAFTKVTHDGQKIADQFFQQYDYERHLKGNFVNDCALISMRLVKKYLPYQTKFGNFAHWDSWLRMFEGEGNVFIYNHIPTWNYYQNPKDMHTIRNQDGILRDLYLRSQRTFIETRLK